MNIVSLLTSFSGRIGRGKFWIGLIVLIVIAIILQLILGAVLPFSITQIVTFVAMFYFAAALYTKRLHDRNKGMMPWLAIFYAPAIVMVLMQTMGIGFENIQMEGQTVSMPSGALGFGIMGIAMIVGFWAIIELGFLRGTKGDNTYGPDPLGQ